MRRAVTILASLCVLAVLAFGTAEVIHLRSQVHNLNRAQSQARSTAAADRLDHTTIQSLATELGDLQATVAGYERGTTQRPSEGSSVVQAINQLERDFNNYCTALDDHLDLNSRVAVESYCPGTYTLLR